MCTTNRNKKAANGSLKLLSQVASQREPHIWHLLDFAKNFAIHVLHYQMHKPKFQVIILNILFW